MNQRFPFVRPPEPDETPLSPCEQIIAMRDHPVRHTPPVQRQPVRRQEAA